MRGMDFAIIPQLATRGCQERSEEAGFVNTMPALKHGGSADGPADQAFEGIEKIVYFPLREIVYWARQVGEVKGLNGLYTECDLIDDAT